MVSGKVSVGAGCSIGTIPIGRRNGLRRGADDGSSGVTHTHRHPDAADDLPASRDTRGAPLELKPVVPAPIDGRY